MNQDLLVGVDVGGTKVRVGLVTSEGRIFASLQEPVAKDSGLALAQQITRLVESVIAGRHVTLIRGVGVAVPAVLNTDGSVKIAPNIPKINGYPLFTDLARSLRYPVIIESDGLASAAGEHWVGAGRGVQEMVFIIIGTGLGGGFVSNGSLVRGADGIAGCLGWSIITAPGGDLIHLEDFCAGPGIAARAMRAVKTEESILRNIADSAGGVLTARDVFMAARSGDCLARRLIDETVHVLGLSLANLVSMLNPEKVILGGSVGLNLGPDLNVLEGMIKQYAQPIAAQRVKLALSELGQDFGVIGAARIAM